MSTGVAQVPYAIRQNAFQKNEGCLRRGPLSSGDGREKIDRPKSHNNARRQLRLRLKRFDLIDAGPKSCGVHSSECIERQEV